MPRSGKSKAKQTEGFAEEQKAWEPELSERLNVTVGPGGRIVIPAVYRKAMQVRQGDRLMACVVDGELRLMTPEMGIRHAQRIVRETIPADVDLVEALFEERRWEAAKEVEDD